jgi:histidine triad (HIT) family protein
VVAKKIAADEGLTNGYRTVFNNGRGAHQEVDHIHMHLLGGRVLGWPPG